MTGRPEPPGPRGTGPPPSAPRLVPQLAPPPGVDIWHVGLDVDPATAERIALLLDAGERQRAGRMRDVLAARRYVVAHGAARTVLGGYLGVAAYAVDWSAGRHGKPAFDGGWSHWQWSLSRSGGHALLAVRLTEPVGVDIEAVREGTPAVALAIRFLHEGEAAAVAAQTDPSRARLLYHRLLSRKEACVKCSGGRLLDGLRIRVLGPGSLGGTVSGTGPMAAERWRLRDLPAPPGFVAALATVGDAIERLRFFEWRWPEWAQSPDPAGWASRPSDGAPARTVPVASSVPGSPSPTCLC